MQAAGHSGGTKTDLAIYSTESGPHMPLVQNEFRSAGYPGLQAIVSGFLGQMRMPVRTASFDMAGPMMNGQAKVTKLFWGMDEDLLALRASDVITINEGNAVANGPNAIVAPGTGLGESFLTWNGAQHVAHGPRGATRVWHDERQIRLLRFLLPR